MNDNLDFELVERSHKMGHTQPSEANFRDPQVEDYLDLVCARLIGNVPYAKRSELRAELAGHLDALVDAYLELGAEPEEAVPLALKQFGDPRKVGQQWASVWQRKTKPAGPQPLLPGIKMALGCHAPAWMMAFTLAGFAEGGNGIQSEAEGFAMIAMMALLPAWSGFLTGFLGAPRPALSCFMVVSALITVTVGLSLPAHLGAGLTLAMIMFILWLPLTPPAAAFGRWLRKRDGWSPARWVFD